MIKICRSINIHQIAIPRRFDQLVYGILLVAVLLPGLFWKLETFPPIWFDEGYKLNAGKTLAFEGVYGTSTADGILPFDPGISSGPLDIVPMAASFLVFEVGLLQARISYVVYSLTALISYFLIGRKLFGYPAAILAVFILIAAPPIQGINFVLLSRQVLGEIPAYSFVLFGWAVWLYAWKGRKTLLLGLAGVCIGLGLLSKTQLAIALLPALGIASVATLVPHFWKRPDGIGPEEPLRMTTLKAFFPTLGILLVLILWFTVSNLLTPPLAQQENSRLLMDAIRTNLLTGLWGRTLSIQSWMITAIMLLSTALSAVFLWSDPSNHRQEAVTKWGWLGLHAFVLLSAVWFAFFSIGWPRYGYAGLFTAILLLSHPLWRALQWLRDHIRILSGLPDQRLLTLLAASLAVFGILTNFYPILTAEDNQNAERVGAYLQAHVPTGALVETWEWEIDIFANDVSIHHPPQEYLFLAIRQFSHSQVPFSLSYPVLDMDPDYLVIGPFSAWTNIYPTDLVSREFKQETSIGEYRIYRRNRE
jgi:hypothetical protein